MLSDYFVYTKFNYQTQTFTADVWFLRLKNRLSPDKCYIQIHLVFNDTDQLNSKIQNKLYSYVRDTSSL